MFWRVASGGVSSINGILERESFTLEDLLEEDDVVQEVKASNKQLLDFLLKDSTLEQLLTLMMTQPEGEEEQEHANKLRLCACEILCSGEHEVLEAVVKHPAFFQRLFAAFGNAPGSDGTAIGCFVQLVGHLMSQRGDALVDWLKGNADVLEGLTDRLEIGGVAETLTRLVGADDLAAPSVSYHQLSWMSDTQLLPRLWYRMQEEGPSAAAENAAEVLTAIARAGSSPLTRLLASPENLERLVGQVVHASTDQGLLLALNICIALIERRRVLETAYERGAASPPPASDRTLEAQAVDALAPHAGTLLAKLGEAQSERRQATPYGLLQPPLGSTRLTVIALLAALVATGLPAAEEAVTGAGLVRKCLDLVLAYPFNSILHHQVASIVASILECGSESLVAHLLDECQLVSWLVEAPAEVQPTSDSLRKGPKAPLRAGYSGHLTLISNKLVATAEARPLVSERLGSHPGWKEFADGRLAEANRLEDVGAWECGRPPLGGLAGDSDDDYGLYGEAPSGGLSGLIEVVSDDDSEEDEPLANGRDIFSDAAEEDEFAGSPGFGDLRNQLWDDANGSPHVGGGEAGAWGTEVELMGMHDTSAASPPFEPAAGLGWTAPLKLPPSAASPPGAARSPEVPNSWEDLALDAASDLHLRRHTPRPPMADSGPTDIPGPRVVGFSAPAAAAQSPEGRPPPQSSRLSEELKCGSPGAATAQSDQAAAAGKAEKGGRPRKRSSDLDSHPLSGRSSLDLEEPGAELSASVAAELDKLGLNHSSSGSGGICNGLSPEHEEQTLVGSFTKLDPGTESSPSTRPPASSAPPQ